MAEEIKKETAPAAAAPAKAEAAKTRKRSVKVPAHGMVHINCSFNNTIVTVTDDKGGTLLWSTSGSHGFKGTKKGTPFAAQITCNKLGEKAVTLGMKEVAVKVCGPGQGRETAVRALQQAGLTVTSIKDVTPIPHNGCRPPKARRV
ncbi:MAG: 30S ribosomal protein S11 [Elusimicrobiota bacterium]|jgi:small subunit ribosomal protein S11|nr:30S ribosomal protein S11 [Elusimicrobiota bacterium]